MEGTPWCGEVVWSSFRKRVQTCGEKRNNGKNGSDDSVEISGWFLSDGEVHTVSSEREHGWACGRRNDMKQRDDVAEKNVAERMSGHKKNDDTSVSSFL